MIQWLNQRLSDPVTLPSRRPVQFLKLCLHLTILFLWNNYNLYSLSLNKLTTFLAKSHMTYIFLSLNQHFKNLKLVVNF